MITKHELHTHIKKEHSAVLVVNTYSRRGQHFFFAAVDELEKHGINVVASYPVRHPDRLPEIIKEAISRGPKLVIVGGGDGTISSIVDYFAYKDVVLGILPLGTGNSFARTLGIPLTLEGAVDVIAQGKVVDVDLGKANDDYFANVVSLGFSADLARNTPRKLKRYLGVLAYGIMGIKNLFSRQAFRCTLAMGKKTHTLRTHQVVIANGSVFGVTKLAPEAHVDNRQLLVFTMGGLSRWQMVKLWIAFFFGKQTALAEARFFTTKEVTVTCDPPQYVDVDGETTTQTPVTISLAPEALKVIVPQQFEEPWG